MGAWSVDVLGGDTPMDALDTFEDVLGIDRGDDFDKEGLYPLRPSDALRDWLRLQLEDGGTAARLLHACDAAWCEEDQNIYRTVLGAMHLTTGATMQASIRDSVVSAAEYLADRAEEHGWNDPEERRGYMKSLARAFREHQPGEIRDIGHVGLFERIAGHVGPGLVNVQA